MNLRAAPMRERVRETACTRDHRIYSRASRFDRVGNAGTEIKERIRRETRKKIRIKKKREKKSNPRASTYTCISGKLAPRESNPTDSTERWGIFHVRGCIIGISAPGRIKSGRRDQWLTRIVGAVRKIPYLHTKIRPRSLAPSMFPTFFPSPFPSPFSLFFFFLSAEARLTALPLPPFAAFRYFA